MRETRVGGREGGGGISAERSRGGSRGKCGESDCGWRVGGSMDERRDEKAECEVAVGSRWGRCEVAVRSLRGRCEVAVRSL